MKYLKPFVWACLAVGVFGCTLQTQIPVTVIVLEPTPTPTPAATQTATPSPTPTPFPYPWQDVTGVMRGVCFEAALERAGQVLTFGSAAGHIAFYDGLDASGACPLPVQRVPFEFQDGARRLAGLWASGRGCDARFEVADHQQAGRTLDIQLNLITEGDCNYELLEPFWVAVEDVDTVNITVEATP